MSLGKEFKEFISRGNVIDLAVGVIIGAAFGKIVTSMVDGIIMPPIGLFAGKVDFSQLKIVLQASDPAAKQAEVAILYGNFLNTIVSFLIVAACVFLLVKVVNRLKREHEAQPPAAPPRTEVLLEEIRDVLKNK
jgi:large conductance mechanosensitive channel